MKNMVAIGATCAVLGMEISVFNDVVDEIFGRKGEEIVKKNMDAITAGYKAMEVLLGEKLGAMELEKADGQKRLFMIGNDAIALGAVAGLKKSSITQVI